VIVWADVVGVATRVLAILGAFALGAWLCGWLMDLLGRKWFKDEKLPAWARNLSRSAGGLLFGLVAYLSIWAVGGGSGWFPGTSNVPGGKDATTSKDRDPKGPKDTKEKAKEKDDGKKELPPATPSTTLRVEVLGDDPLTKLAKGGKIDRERRYRVRGVAGLLTLEELKKRVVDQQQSKSPLKKVVIVKYLDSPTGLPVAELEQFLRDLPRPIVPDVTDDASNAPLD
jgi:hypothetical protein